MQYFANYTSNTLAGSANQHFFTMVEGEMRTGRVFYRITNGGRFRYSLLFSNTIDSTYSDGSVSHRNLLCDEWQIHQARIARCGVCADWQELNALTEDWKSLTFAGQHTKAVMPGELFASDPVEMAFAADEYLCLEITFSGPQIPYHEESILPVFTLQNGQWVYDKRMPLASMVGCDQPRRPRIGFLGDSITQGIGTPINSYAHWNAVLARKLGSDYAYWNLGIGYARANDMAEGGAWMFKACQNDLVVLCAGVNDLGHIRCAGQTCADLKHVVHLLHEAGCKVVVQTIPPFDYQGEAIAMWETCNRFIQNELDADGVFDVVPVLGLSQKEPYRARYGGHPDETGCAVWGETLYHALHECGILSKI